MERKEIKKGHGVTQEVPLPNGAIVRLGTSQTAVFGAISARGPLSQIQIAEIANNDHPGILSEDPFAVSAIIKEIRTKLRGTGCDIVRKSLPRKGRVDGLRFVYSVQCSDSSSPAAGEVKKPVKAPSKPKTIIHVFNPPNHHTLSLASLPEHKPAPSPDENKKTNPLSKEKEKEAKEKAALETERKKL